MLILRCWSHKNKVKEVSTKEYSMIRVLEMKGRTLEKDKDAYVKLECLIL